MKDFDKCIEYCDIILGKDSNKKDIQKLRQKSMTAIKFEERDSRKKKRFITKKDSEEKMLLQTIFNRNLSFDFQKGEHKIC